MVDLPDFPGSRLTETQADVWLFIAEHIEREGWPPTVHEICQAFDWTHNGALYHLRVLEKKGYLTIGSGVRQIRLAGVRVKLERTE